jgi:hypothetical protein
MSTPASSLVVWIAIRASYTLTNVFLAHHTRSTRPLLLPARRRLSAGGSSNRSPIERPAVANTAVGVQLGAGHQQVLLGLLLARLRGARADPQRGLVGRTAAAPTPCQQVNVNTTNTPAPLD